MAAFGPEDRLVIDEDALKRYLDSPDGPVFADLMRRGQNVETAAKLNASGAQVAGAINPEGRGPRVRSGRLRSSISHRPGRDAQGAYVDVGTAVFYGRILERGELPGGRKYPFLVPALPAAQF